MNPWAPICAVLAWSCGFSPSAITDAGADATDSRPDAEPIRRVKQGLIGFWTFNEPDGSRIAADTSGSADPVPLQVITSPTIAAPTFSGGALVVDPPARLFSALSTRLNGDCISKGAVTLEVWARPLVGDPNPTDPLFVAGLATMVQTRNIALLQAGTRWVGRVRTTAAADGTPDLTSTSTVSTTSFSHIAIVASASERTMYVDDAPQAVGTPGTLDAWDPTYPLALVDEYQHARMWTGTLTLVALYNRALTPAEVHQNFVAGPLN